MNKYRTVFLFSVFFLLAAFVLIQDRAVAGANIAAQKAAQKGRVLKPISAEEAGQKALAIVNAYFVREKDATLSGTPVEESGLYRVDAVIEKMPQRFYITKDGKRLLFPDGSIDIAEFEANVKKSQEAQKAAAEATTVPKTDRPVVELFVMSLCPFGVKAEKEIVPVIKSFGAAVDFKVKFLVKAKGLTIDTVDSLHGNQEAREDARQAAIMKYYPDKFGVYIEKAEKNFCLLQCGAGNLDEYWKKVAKELKIDTKKIESFAYGKEGMDLLMRDEADAAKYKASASPTLVINGIISRSIYEGPEAVRKAICSAFMNPIHACLEKSESGAPKAPPR